MKKTLPILLLLTFLLPSFSYAEEASSSILISNDTEVVASTTIKKPIVKSFTVCSQEAIEKRDTAIAASRSLYNIAMSNALTERKNREKAAIALDDATEKKDAIKLSVDTYKHQAKVAQTTLTQARKVIWQTFDTDVATCRTIEQAAQTDILTGSSTDTAPTLKKSDIADIKTDPVKTFQDVIKAQIENIKSLFN